MNLQVEKLLKFFLTLAVVIAIVGCPPAKKPPEPITIGPDATIGSLTQLFQPDEIPVIGYGIVAGLPGTGSSECPPTLREPLIKYIWQQLPSESRINPENFIKSQDTAVVEVYGRIPIFASKGQIFDVKVGALSSTQTVSLDGGRLYSTELKESSRLRSFDQFAKPFALAQGPIFINKLDKTTPITNEGYVLGGGVASENTPISLTLNIPDYILANAVRNRINERFGPKTAKAISQQQVQINIPKQYLREKETFFKMVSLLYLTERPQLIQQRINDHVDKLVNQQNKRDSELALTAIGTPALNKLLPLLKSDDEALRFHAARCVLSIGNNSALPIMQQIINDRNSPYRIEAIKATATYAKRKDALPLLNVALAETDFAVKYAAYEQLRKLNDISISRTLLAGDFFVDSVTCSGPKIIFVSRSTTPRVVLFGAPITCKKNIFIKSPDDEIIINASATQDTVSVMRKHPKRPKLIGPLNTSFALTDVIQGLCQEPTKDKTPGIRVGLGIPYSDLIELLQQMCLEGAVNAQFIAGDMITVDQIMSLPPKSEENTP
jgi:flagellar basal body P-ring protein FlgI